MPNKIDYKAAGVDVEAGDALVDWLRDDKRPWPHQDRIVGGIGGFAALFRVGFPEMKKPCLVTCTDGVGTKVKLAADLGDYSTVGQDLVAMCVNDLICTGGRPLMFLDYYATGRLDLTAAQAFLKSVAEACRESDCALIGGETAEMPGLYHGRDFDCAGFAVGIVDEEKAWGPHRVQAGDHVFAVSSSGFHSNGFSLLRKIFAGEEEKRRTELLRPTALYVKLAIEAGARCEIHAAAHITGGGIENIPRALPEGWTWENKAWPIPDTFLEVQRRAGLTTEELQKTLNCGIGFCFVAPQKEFEALSQIAEKAGHQLFDLGEVRS